MIILYEKTEATFTHNGLCVLDANIISPMVTEELNGLFMFEFDYPMGAPYAKELVTERLVKCPVPDMPDQLFRITLIQKNLSGLIHVAAYHVFYDLVDNLIEDTYVINKTGQQAVEHILSATQYAHPFTASSNIPDIATARLVRLSPAEVLLNADLENGFLARWGGEIIRDNFHIYLQVVRGSNNGVSIRDKKNLTGYSSDLDYQAVVTRIMPQGYDGLFLPEKYVDSPRIAQYVKPKIRVIKYEFIKAAIGDRADDEDAVPLNEAYRLLRSYAAKEYSVHHLDVPQASYAVQFAPLAKTEEYKNFAALETAHIGDTVTVQHEADGFEVAARMVAYQYDPLLEAYISVTLGSYTPSMTDIVKDIRRVEDGLNLVREEANYALQSANGKNTNYYGSARPAKPREGDLWFRENGDKTELWIYETREGVTQWYPLINDLTFEELREELERAAELVEEAKSAAEDAVAAGEEAKAAADQAYQLGEEAKEAAEDALAKGQEAMEAGQAALDALAQANEDAAEALRKANQAFADAAAALAKSDSITEELEGIAQDATDALASANEALEAVGDLEDSVTTELSNFGGQLQAKADKTVVDTLSGTVTQHKTLITQNAEAIALKASQSTVDTLTGRVDAAETSISQNAGQIALKANQSAVDTLAGRVSTAETTITQHAGQIALKASQSAVDTLTGRVSSAETSISQQAGLIALKASQSDLDKLTGRVSTAESTILQQADLINLRVTKNDVINQINISTEGILISGSKVHITGTTKIDNAVIKTALIADLAVSTAKIANLAVSTAKIADLAVTNAKIGSLAVGTANIQSLAVTGAKIADATITNAKISTLDAGKINTGTLAAARIAAGSITSDKLTIANGFIKNAMIADATIASAKILSIDAAKITTGTLAAARIAAGSITADKLAANAIQVGLAGWTSTIRITPTQISWYSGTTLEGTLNASGMNFYYGAKFIGQMGESYDASNTSLRGISTHINGQGDYATWAYRTGTSGSYTRFFTLDPRGRLGSGTGISLGTPVRTHGNIFYTSGNRGMVFADVTLGSTTYGSLSYSSGGSRVAFSSSALYLITANTYYNCTNVMQRIKDLMSRVNSLISMLNNGWVKSITSQSGGGISWSYYNNTGLSTMSTTM